MKKIYCIKCKKESAKYCGFVSQILAWVAWHQKILGWMAWIKQNSMGWNTL